MADAVLGLLLHNLNSLIHSEFGLLHGVKEEVEKLSLKLSTVRAVIEDAEIRQHTDQAIVVWLRRLKDTSFDAEDVLDEWLIRVRLSELESTQVTQSCASFPFNQLAFRHKIAKKIKKIHADFDSIAGEISKFDLKTRVVERGDLLDPNRETSSLLVEPKQVYGRDKDHKNIMDMLICDASSSDDVSVLPIVGVGGLGKTTLAQLVYNDERVSEHFESRMWVCVAEDFDVKRLTTLIIECLSSKNCDLKGLDSLQKHLKELLSGRRFLLVLDDVWNDDRDTWGKLKQSLTCGAKGSCILLTTRLETVASMMGTLSLYSLPYLSDDECWTLFKACAYCMDDEDLSIDMVEIGKQIVKKCGGIPLVTKVLGALLRFKRNVHEWDIIRGSEIWELPEEKGGAILGVLRLSYNHLPSELKQCFSYCSLYPKDSMLIKTELIQLWMANGFIRCIGRMELEDMGNYIFNELLRGSFFQEPWKDKFGNIFACKMHDLMHDLAGSLTKTECCVVEVEKMDTVPKSVRHLSLIATSTKPLSKPYKSLCKSNKCLRTHMEVSGSYGFKFQEIQLIFSKLKYLRVLMLDLSKIPSRQVPNSIGCMKCLRYLNLYGNHELEFLPDSICSLINLQTLDLKGCRGLIALPKHTSKMRNLRYLDFDVYSLREMPTNMGQMVELRTLSGFVVGKRKGQQINELNGLKHLSGELLLSMLEHVNDSTEAKEADLANKPNLTSLHLFWGEILFPCRPRFDLQEEEKKKSERVLECLQPHVNLNQQLKVGGYQGVLFPSWMTLLQNLSEIQLLDCWNCETLPSLGQLPRLRVLELRRMPSLKCIGVEFCGEVASQLKGFPSLEDLCIKEMPDLEKWEFPLLNDALFPCLRNLSISDCPKLERPSIFMPTSCCLKKLNSLTVCFPTQSLSNLTALETLEISHKESLQSGEIENLTILKSLNIQGCYNVPDEIGNLTALNSLCFTNCYELKSIPDEIGNLTALVSLEIFCCEKLIFLPAEGLQKLTSLKYFTIRDCKSLKTLPAMGRMIQEGTMMRSSCCSLVRLRIEWCDSLTSVSEGLAYLTSLEELSIHSCKLLELKKEDFRHLTSLRHLLLHDLPKLISVPDVQNLTALQSLGFMRDQNLSILPEGIQQHLTSLRALHVYECHPDLHKRLEKNKGVDWPNISHIPEIDIRLKWDGHWSWPPISHTPSW